VSVKLQMATAEHCIYCFDSLLYHFEEKNYPVPKFSNDKYPLFVSWHKESHSATKEPSLRGCKGTFSPQEIHKGLQEYALISALKDKRFSPVTFSEVTRLHCGVSLLFNFEEVNSVWDWEIGTHGIIIDFEDKHGNQLSATYLPEVAEEQQWNKVETIDSLIKKAGFESKVSDELLGSIKTTRYQSSKINLSYAEYKSYKKNQIGGK